MKSRKTIFKALALLLILTILPSPVSVGADGNGHDAPGTAYYSDWLKLENQLVTPENPDQTSGTSDLRQLLQEAALLDAEGTLLAENGVWPVEPDGSYQIRLRFSETPGNGQLQFDAENTPLVFQLPEGLKAGKEYLQLPVRIELGTGESAEAACIYNTSTGILSVDWDSNGSASEQIRTAEDASFELVIPAAFEDNTDKLAFADHLAVSLQRAETGIKSSRGPVRSAPDESSDLADFLDSIEVEGAEIVNGKYVIQEGVPYTITMHFSEKTNGIQFDVDADHNVLTYQLPDGFNSISTNGTGVISGADGDIPFSYVYSGGTVTVTLDKTSPGYASFLNSENAKLDLNVTGTISKDKLVFSSEVSGEFDINDTHEVTVSKTGNYDPELNKIKF